MRIKINDTDLVLTKEYTTHIGVLIKMVLASEGPILELGGGLFSTPLLHWMCEDNQRLLYTYEHNQDFMTFLERFNSNSHHVISVDNWETVKFPEIHWGMVFIDHNPGRHHVQKRQDAALKLKNNSDFIVIHDTEERGFRDGVFWSNFKYLYHWRKARPYVSVMSDLKEIKL